MRRNKKDYLIVDGYNIINAWDELKEIAISDLEHAREKLIDAIIEYAEFTGRLGIIVFDAYNIKSCKEKIEKRKNMLDIVKWWWYLIKAVAWDGVRNIYKASDFEIYSLYNLPIMIRNQFIRADEMTWKKMKKVVDIEKWMW